MSNPFNQDLLQRKVKSRKAAEAVIELLKESIDGDMDEGHFWRIVRDRVLVFAPLQRLTSPIEPMTDVETRRFENGIMPYGEFKGRTIKNVPLDRLDWYAGNDDFRDDLKKYLANEEVRLRVREEVGE